MAGVEPVSNVSAAAATDPGAQTADTQVQQAFAQGIVRFMGSMLQSSESDIIAAINDDTSTPDSPG